MSTAWATIIGAVVAAAASIVVSILNNNKQNALWSYRLEQLEKKQDKHNSTIERTYHIEQTMAVLEEKMKVAGHRIDDLEKTTGGNPK